MLKLTAPASACSPSPSDDFRYSSLFAVKEETRWVLTLVATKSLDRCQPEVEKEASRGVSYGNQLPKRPEGRQARGLSSPQTALLRVSLCLQMRDAEERSQLLPSPDCRQLGCAGDQGEPPSKE